MIWSFCNKNTGEFIGKTFSARNDAELERNTPNGCLAIFGYHDPNKEKYDIESEQCFLCDSPKKANPKHEAMARIRYLEIMQARPIRELTLDPNNSEALEVLNHIEEQIKECRKHLR